MRRVAIVLGTAGVLTAGVTAAVALGSGAGAKIATAPTSTTVEMAVPKVWLCHHTGSWKHPYHLIHISGHAVAAHRRHGDLDPGAGNSCPTTQPAGAKQHGKRQEAGKTPGNSASNGKSSGGKDAADTGDDDPGASHP
jgi:hypothetical protein